MIASLSNRFVFLHVPKNGGTTVRSAIREAFSWDRSVVEGWGIEEGIDLAHLFPACLKKRFPDVYEMLGQENTHSIAIVRDPQSRCVAAFREHRRHYRDHPTACESLSDYLNRIEDGSYREAGGAGNVFIHGAPQHEFIFDEGRLLPSDVLRLDDALLFPKLCLLVGAVLPATSHTNATAGESAYIPAAEVRRILRIYEKDYELIDSLA